MVKVRVRVRVQVRVRVVTVDPLPKVEPFSTLRRLGQNRRPPLAVKLPGPLKSLPGVERRTRLGGFPMRRAAPEARGFQPPPVVSGSPAQKGPL
jgi:hypothetical protein